MLQLKVKPHLSLPVLKKKLKSQQDVRLFLYWQIVYSVAANPGKKAEEYSSILGINKEKVYRIVQLYNKQGEGFDSDLEWGGRREERSKMTLKEEETLLRSIEGKAKKGQILTLRDLKKQIENYLGAPVSEDYVWDLFSRHNWKKKAPRPEHPDKNQKNQKDFKKNSPSYWAPVS